MSNSMSLFQASGYKNVDLSYLQAGGLDETTKSLMGGGGDYKRISIRGGVFRMIVGGKEVAVNEDRTMNVIIVAAAPKTNRIYYGSTYTEGESARPLCTSANGHAPDADSTNPQATSCELCPQNIAGSGTGNSRACRFQRRLGVVLENDIESGDVYQLVLPAKSIFGTGEAGKMPLEQYAKFLGGHNISVLAVVTQLRFDVSADTPKLTFSALRPLTEEEYLTVIELGKSKPAIDAIQFDPAVLDSGSADSKPVAKVVPKLEPSKPKAKPAPVEEVDDEEEEDYIPAPPPKAKPKASKPKQDASEVDIVEFVKEQENEPVKRPNKKVPTPPADDVLAILDEWGDDD